MKKYSIVKRVLLVLLALVLAVPPVDLRVSAAQPDGTCPHCNQVAQWTAWDGATTLGAGHYILEAETVTVSATKTISSEVVIDLNGKSLELASGKRKMFLVKDDAKLVFLDSSQEQTGTVTSYQTQGYHAGLAQIQGGKLDIYGGTFRLRDGGAAQRGGLFYVYKNTNAPVVNIYGGTFYGAKAYYSTKNDGGGGVIYIGNGTLNISGGTFYPGLDSLGGDTIYTNSDSAKVTISGDPVIYGGVEVKSASYLKISGNPTILRGNKGCDYSVKLPAGEVLTVGQLEASARIGITADGVFTADFADEAAAEAAKSCFVTDDGKDIAVEGKALITTGTATEPTEPEVTEPEVTEPEVTEPTTEPTEPQPTQPGDKIYCPYGHASHAGVDCDAQMITWSEWTSTTSLPTTGSYYLSGDVTIKATSKPSGLNLDLNGCDVTRIIEVGDTDDCNVFSPVENQVFILTDTNAERHGIVSVNWETGAETANANKLGKVVKVSANATMKMYGGIIDGSNITGNKRTSVTNATLNVENGTDKNNAAFYMYGGKILGMQNYTVDAAGTKTYSSGSAIIARSGTTLEIYGGEIVGGEAKNGACVHSATDKTKLMGGKYTGGAVSSSAAIAYINANKITIGDVDMDGGVFIYKEAAKLTLVGSPKITNEGFSTYGICFGASSTGMIDATGMDSDARINIRSSRTDIEAPFAKVDEDLSGCFTVWNEGYQVQYNETDKTLYLAAYSPIETSACVCKDCKGETVPQWTAWDGTTALSAGHYYLEKDIEMTASGVIDSAEAATVVLNLNGFALTKAAFRLQGKTNLVVMDSSAYATGKVTGNATIIVTESAESSAEIYGGTFSLSADAAKAANGALIYANKGSIKVAGGEFQGAAAEKGGVVAVNTGAALEITGGVFHPGTADHGDTLYAASGSTVTIGGTAQLEGGIEIAENVSVTVSDTPVVRKLKGGSAYALKTSSLMNVETLSVGARIFVTGTQEAVFANVLTEEETPDVIGRFFSADSENMKIVADGNTLKVIPMVIDPEVIQQRRDIVESYMREQATMLWTATEDITYCFSTNTDDPSKEGESRLIHIKKGRIYRGLPYAYSYTTMTSFMDYAGEPDENGVYPISGLTYPAMSGSGNTARMGNDCSSSVASSWSQIGASIYATTSSGYVPRYGAVPVGDYIPLESYDDTNGTGTLVVVQNNGTEVMYESYAKLQKADALVRWKSANNHTMLVVSCKVVRNADGSINPTSSYVTVLEQTSSNVRNERTYQDPVLGTVYYIYGVDKQYSFKYLFDNTYIPMTCMELIDAAPVAAPVITDTQIEEHTIDNLFEGKINSTWLIDCVTVTITDAEGKEVQKGAQNARRGAPREFIMESFVTGKPEWTRGGIDTEALADGAYNCKVVCRLNTMEEFTVRDFAFTVGESQEPSVPTDPTEPSVPTEPTEPSEPEAIRGDLNNDGAVSDADAMYLLRYTLFGDGRYPLNQGGDVNGDGAVSDADAMYLLRYTLFGPSRYPLH